MNHPHTPMHPRLYPCKTSHWMDSNRIHREEDCPTRQTDIREPETRSSYPNFPTSNPKKPTSTTAPQSRRIDLTTSELLAVKPPRSFAGKGQNPTSSTALMTSYRLMNCATPDKWRFRFGPDDRPLSERVEEPSPRDGSPLPSASRTDFPFESIQHIKHPHNCLVRFFPRHFGS